MDKKDIEQLDALMGELDVPRIPQQARSRQKRDAIMTAAGRLFEERGYDATTADDIAQAAEVSIGTFYSYFRNKRQVFLALFMTSYEAFLALRVPEADLAHNPRQMIHKLVQQGMEKEGIEFGLQRAWREIIPRDPELAAYHDRFHQLMYEQILAAGRRAQAQGLLWSDLDLEATCWSIAILLDRVWDTAPREKTTDDAHSARLCDALADLIYRALFKS